MCTIGVAFLSATILGMSEENGTMTWFARPYYLLPLYVFPSLALTLILPNLFKEKLSSSVIGIRGKALTNLDKFKFTV